MDKSDYSSELRGEVDKYAVIEHRILQDWDEFAVVIACVVSCSLLYCTFATSILIYIIEESTSLYFLAFIFFNLNNVINMGFNPLYWNNFHKKLYRQNKVIQEYLIDKGARISKTDVLKIFFSWLWIIIAPMFLLILPIILPQSTNFAGLLAVSIPGTAMNFQLAGHLFMSFPGPMTAIIVASCVCSTVLVAVILKPIEGISLKWWQIVVVWFVVCSLQLVGSVLVKGTYYRKYIKFLKFYYASKLIKEKQRQKQKAKKIQADEQKQNLNQTEQPLQVSSTLSPTSPSDDGTSFAFFDLNRVGSPGLSSEGYILDNTHRFSDITFDLDHIASGDESMATATSKIFKLNQNDLQSQSKTENLQYGLALATSDLHGKLINSNAADIISARKRSKRIYICFGKKSIRTSRWWNVQSIFNSVPFWLFFAFFIVSGFFEIGTIISGFLFVLVCCAWHPYYYSGHKENAYKKMNENDRSRVLCGICGYLFHLAQYTQQTQTGTSEIIWCNGCCLDRCVDCRDYCNCTPIVCAYTSYIAFGYINVAISATISLLAVIWIVATNAGKIVEGDFNDGVELPDIVDTFEIFMLVDMVIVAGFYFIPSLGYLFYRSPISFAVSHFACSLIFCLLPSTVPISRKNQTRLTDFIQLKEPTDEEKLFVPILLSIILVVLFLAISGFSCAYYRFRRALLLSQAALFGLVKGKDIQTYPLTLMMCIALFLAFFDLVSDLYLVVFVEKQWNDVLLLVARILFGLEILLQLFSLTGVVSTIKKKLRKNNSNKTQIQQQKAPYVTALSEVVEENMKKHTICKIVLCNGFGKFLVYPLYYLFIVILSLVLGLTKLLAIKQIEEYWLSWLVVDYKNQLDQAQVEMATMGKIKPASVGSVSIQTHTVYSTMSNNLSSTVNDGNNNHDIDNNNHNNISNNINNRTNENFNISGDHNITQSEVQQEEDFDASVELIISPDSPLSGPVGPPTPQYATKVISLTSTEMSDNETKMDNNYNIEDKQQLPSQMSMLSLSPMPRASGTTAAPVSLEFDETDLEDEDDDKEMTPARLKLNLASVSSYSGKSRITAMSPSIGLGTNIPTTPQQRKSVIKQSSGLWLCVDRHTPSWISKYDVDPNIYNNFWITELVVESLPQLIINVSNSYFRKTWSETSIVSAVFSIAIVLFSICKIIYKIGFQGLDLKKTLL